MGIIDQKRDIFGNLDAMSALKNLPRPDVNSSLDSINNKLSSTDFLIDLTTALVGAKALKDYVVDVITNRLPEIEDAIKDGLKTELKELVSCNLNPSIPIWFQHPSNGGTGTGVNLKITDIDFYDTMKVDPNSFEGGLIYTDIGSGISSQDFDTYLWNSIDTSNVAGTATATSWGSSVSGTDILESTFLETGSIAGNNAIKYTTSPIYSTKTLPDFNNNFIDTLSLFGNPFSLDSPTVVALIIESLFGSISSSPGIKKSKKQIIKELEIQEVLDCILESEDSNITDNFFTFDNPTLAKIDRESNNRRNGIRELETCGNLHVQVTSKTVSDAMDTILSAATKTKAEQIKAVTEALNNVAETQATFAPNPTDEETVRTNFFMEIIRKLQRVIMSAIMTPQFMSLFAINHQIIHGQGSSYDGGVDFMKKNRKLIKNIGKVVLNMLLSLLLNLAIGYITIRLKEKFADDEIEKAKNYISQLLSYTGVPPGVIARIREINSPGIPNSAITI